MYKKSILMITLILVFCLLAGCGDERKVEVQYNVCSEEYRCDSVATGVAATPVHFYLPQDHGSMVITFNTSETFGFSSDMSNALTDFPATFGEAYTINSEIVDLSTLAMSAIGVGLDVAIMQYLDKNNVILSVAEQISGYQVGHYYCTAYDNQNNILFDSLLPEGKTTLALSENVERIDIYSYIDAGLNQYFPDGVVPGTVAYEGAYEVSGNVIDTSDIVKYEDLNVFDKAKEIGYEVFELGSSSYGYFLSFVLDGSTSILVCEKRQSGVNILFVGHPMTSDSDVYFTFLGVNYSDKENDKRDAEGHWTISSRHKKELLDLLYNYKSSGIIAFSNFYFDADSYLDGELKKLVKDLGLIVKVMKTNYEVGYNFYFFDENGKMAWFPAIYSEADFRPNEKAYAINTWDNGESFSVPFGRYDFKIDYVDENFILNIEPERIQQLQNFFTSN